MSSNKKNSPSIVKNNVKPSNPPDYVPNPEMDKVNNEGWESLTINEEEFLTNASKRLFDDHSPN